MVYADGGHEAEDTWSRVQRGRQTEASGKLSCEYVEGKAPFHPYGHQTPPGRVSLAEISVRRLHVLRLGVNPASGKKAKEKKVVAPTCEF